MECAHLNVMDLVSAVVGFQASLPDPRSERGKRATVEYGYLAAQYLSFLGTLASDERKKKRDEGLKDVGDYCMRIASGEDPEPGFDMLSYCVSKLDENNQTDL